MRVLSYTRTHAQLQTHIRAHTHTHTHTHTHARTHTHTNTHKYTLSTLTHTCKHTHTHAHTHTHTNQTLPQGRTYFKDAARTCTSCCACVHVSRGCPADGSFSLAVLYCPYGVPPSARGTWYATKVSFFMSKLIFYIVSLPLFICLQHQMPDFINLHHQMPDFHVSFQ